MMFIKNLEHVSGEDTFCLRISRRKRKAERFKKPGCIRREEKWEENSRGDFHFWLDYLATVNSEIIF